MKNNQLLLENLMEMYQSYLKKCEFSDATIAQYRKKVRELIIYMNEKNFSSYDESIGENFLQYIKTERSFTDNMLKSFDRSIVLLNLVLSGAPYIPKKLTRTYPMPGNIGDYSNQFLEKFLTETRPSAGTIYNYKGALSYFSVRMSSEKIRLETLCESVLYKFIASLAPTQTHLYTPIRRFLLHLYEEKYIVKNLSVVFSVIKPQRGEKIPSFYTAEEISKIESIVERTSALGKRNYAMLLLASRLGLRSSDIRTLQFSNIDWDKNMICLEQYKTKRNIELPLLSDVGEAIIDYIMNGRPKSDIKMIFLSSIHPYRPITTATFSTIVSNYIYQTGVEYKGRRHGAHSLRHSLATNMLQNGATLPVISEVLGHGNSQTTMIYLSVDINNLLHCSLNVPPVENDFYIQKGGSLYE